MQQPRTKYWDAANPCGDISKGCLGQGILLGSDFGFQLSGHCDSDWAMCPIIRRSLSGYVVMSGDYPIAWKTKKHLTISCSLAEAEYCCMGLNVREMKWNRQLLAYFGVSHAGPMHFLCDNQAALHIAANLVFHERTKHFEVDCHFVGDEIKDGSLVTSHVRTTEQLADIFTKALGSQ